MTEAEIMQGVYEKARNTRLLILDVDGVLTDGRLFFDNQGNEYKSFHSRDGFGLKLLRQTGMETAVISGRKSKSVALRMKNLGIEFVYQGFDDKVAAFDEIIAKTKLKPEQTAYVGDDLIDLPVMVRAGLAIAVGDAHPAVKQRADWCTQRPGGHGAVREVCDFIMQAQGHWGRLLDHYLQ
ncbi:MAG: 3-deoxy-manno-octulosonate-8-phosphatase KdsC [Gammaproteobacteria bacterium]